MDNERFSFRSRFRSFRFAGQGIRALARYEHNFRIHICAALIALCLGFLLNISTVEWCLIIFAIAMVLGAEALNTALEVICDKITTERDPLVGRAKDVSAAGVLFVAISALIVGILIFLPKIITWLLHI